MINEHLENIVDGYAAEEVTAAAYGVVASSTYWGALSCALRSLAEVAVQADIFGRVQQAADAATYTAASARAERIGEMVADASHNCSKSLADLATRIPAIVATYRESLAIATGRQVTDAVGGVVRELVEAAARDATDARVDKFIQDRGMSITEYGLRHPEHKTETATEGEAYKAAMSAVESVCGHNTMTYCTSGEVLRLTEAAVDGPTELRVDVLTGP